MDRVHRSQLLPLVLLFLSLCLPGLVRAQSSIGDYDVYYGMLHSHTSVSDGSGTPAQAYTHARDVAGLDFFGLAEHGYWPDNMTDADWALLGQEAENFNEDGVFVAFRGFEWTSDIPEPGWETLTGSGHFTIVNSADWCNARAEETNELEELVEWLSTRDAVAFFNHPGQYSTTFDQFDFPHSEKIVGMELWNRSTDYFENDGYHGGDGGLNYYDEALVRGWYIGASGSQDNHGTDWGDSNQWRLAVLANELTRPALYEAMQERRFYSTRDRNIALSFQGNGEEMGSRIAGGAISFRIQATDGNSELFSRVQLIQNGVVIREWTPDATNLDLTHEGMGSLGDYFYVRLDQGNAWRAVSSPIFVAIDCDQDPSLGVNFAVDLACADRESCFTDTVSGGMPPYQLEWDYGDGSMPEVGEDPCHVFAEGGYTVTLTVRDAMGCTAQVEQVIDVVSPEPLPEVSPPGSGAPLTVRLEDASTLRIGFETVGHDVGLYAGTLAGLHSTGYDHETTLACRVVDGQALLARPPSNSYLVAVSAACEGPRGEGPFGRASDGSERPTADELGTATCP